MSGITQEPATKYAHICGPCLEQSAQQVFTSPKSLADQLIPQPLEYQRKCDSCDTVRNLVFVIKICDQHERPKVEEKPTDNVDVVSAKPWLYCVVL
jgi:hypothetical protein